MSLPSNFLPFEKFIAEQEQRVSSASVLVLNKDGAALVVKAHYKPYWSLPGGVIDHGESPRQAAVRELHEEAGLTIDGDDLQFEAVLDRRSSIAETYAFVFRLTQALDKNHPIHIQASEIEAYDWVSKADVRAKTRGKYNRAIKNWASDNPQVYLEHVVQ